MRKTRKRIWIFFACIGMFAIGVMAVMLLWNWLMPAVFGLTTISFLQALGLMLLARLLVDGFGPKGGRFHRMHDHVHRHHPDLHDKMRGMNSDQRREFIRNHMFGGPCGEGRPVNGGGPGGGPGLGNDTATGKSE